MSPEGHGNRDTHQVTVFGCAVITYADHVRSLGWASLSSRLKTQAPTVTPAPGWPQRPRVQDHTHKPPLKTWSSSLGTHVSVTSPSSSHTSWRHSASSISPILIQLCALLPLKPPSTAPPPSGPNARASSSCHCQFLPSLRSFLQNEARQIPLKHSQLLYAHPQEQLQDSWLHLGFLPNHLMSLKHTPPLAIKTVVPPPYFLG